MRWRRTRERENSRSLGMLLPPREPGANQPTPDPSKEGNWPAGVAPLLGGAGGGFGPWTRRSRTGFRPRLVIRAFIHKRAGLFGRRQNPEQIEISAPDELVIAAQIGWFD